MPTSVKFDSVNSKLCKLYSFLLAILLLLCLILLIPAS